MSFKGFQKALVRTPQTLRQKLNMAETTSDAVYEDAERRFKELEEQTKRLSDESKRYHKAVNDMLDHQLNFSKSIEEIFKPISGKASDPNSTIPEGNPEGIEACIQYRDVVIELKETLKPDLELIETRIVGPAQELLKIIQAVRKMSVKRNHKRVDLDRHQTTLKRLQNKKEPTAKDEEKMYKAESEVAIAQQEFDYYNEMMKTELPIMFKLEGEMIKPLFVSLYYMQLNVFYTLSSRMEEMKIPYFDLSTDILESFNYKRGDIQERAEAIGITHFKIGHAKNKLEATRRRYGQNSEPTSPITAGSTFTSPYGTINSQLQTPPTTASTVAPAYGAAAGYGADQKTGYPTDQKSAYSSAAPSYAAPSYSSAAPTYSAAAPTYSAAAPAYGAPAAAVPAAPSAVPAPVAGNETCTALYDYAAQAQGDLSFTAGSVITIIQKTPDQNGWWTGSVNGVTGVFPGNYVQLNQV
ncbi:unnamed protein product [Ambrosiozyma monospora]|uniref:Unnamed protein product n=1 Tax=Ambrosiozyma monospora TaxID=43982 RepID=A0A9W7DJI8_AMBMO|nr:unnamed protein product [Ambrosiozyma monospora]